MTKTAVAVEAESRESVDLKDPAIAALLAWLVPGLGHFYQGRTVKGVLFSVCILGTFFFGLLVSDGKAVYASWQPDDRRLPFLCQIGVGLPAMPALVQAMVVRSGRPPLLGGLMAPPANAIERSEWYKSLNRYFELGTVYTMIAGLLNILVIYDAFAGPVYLDDPTRKPSTDPPPDSG